MRYSRFSGFITLLIAGLAITGVTQADDEILPPQEVFLYTVNPTEEALLIEWEVLPDHYMYRKRFGFKSGDPRMVLGNPKYPQGEIHDDEFFGEVETYRGAFVVEIPYTLTEPTTDTVALQIKSQGCADRGICYPPQTWEAGVPLAQLASTEPAETVNLLSALAPGGGFGDDGFLHPDEAFVLEAEVTDSSTMAARWVIADGYYLYRHSVSASTKSDRVQLGEVRLPDGKAKHDEFFGDTEVYYRQLDMTVPFTRAGPEAGEFEAVVTYQGCADAGLCYPPIRKTVNIVFGEATAETAAALVAGGSGPLSEQDRFASGLSEGNLLLVLGGFFLAGLGLAFTPCVLPMVPILSGIIAGQGENATTARSFLLSLAYVLGMAFTYSLAGALFAAAGSQVQALFQAPWIVTLFSLLFVALAFAMFGAYELQMPASIQTRLANAGNKQKAGTYLGTGVMGALSALVVTACVGPALVGALTFISQTGDVVRGASALFVMSLGMGTPLLLVGASAGKLLPKAGPWMEQVKTVFGILFLAVAVWLVSRIVSETVTMWLWAGLAVLSGVLLGAFRSLSTGWPKFAKAAGIAVLAYGMVLTLGAGLGGKDPLRPLHGTSLLPGTELKHLEFTPIKTVADLEAAVARASEAGQTVMLDFYADWCVSCKEMEKYSFTDENVQAALKDTVLLQADVTKNDEADQALLKHFGIFGPPTIAFFGPDGTEQTAYRVVGFMEAESFHRHVQDALNVAEQVSAR